ncbi:MAG: hypothetical protein KY468_12515, partial [Armatimonadetes bacterium]|nr:hypothetical protein [Armatimonadota bacterium]
MLSEWLLPLVTWALFLLSAGGTGYALLHAIRFPPRSPGETGVLSLSLGLALYSLMFFFLGFIGGWTPLAAGIVTLVGLLLFLWRVAKRGGSIPALLGKYRAAFGRLSPWGKSGIFLLSLLLSTQFLAALAPPSAVDTLTYHLTLPKLYTDAGRWIYRPDLFFADNPSAVQMLYLACRLLGAEETATLLHWTFGVLLAAGTVLFVREQFPDLSPGYGILAALLLASLPLFAFETTSAFADLPTAHYTLLGVWLGL